MINHQVDNAVKCAISGGSLSFVKTVYRLLSVEVRRVHSEIRLRRLNCSVEGLAQLEDRLKRVVAWKYAARHRIRELKGIEGPVFTGQSA